MPRKKSQESQEISPEQHFANLQWLKAKGYYLDARRWADYQRLNKELNQLKQGIYKG